MSALRRFDIREVGPPTPGPAADERARSLVVGLGAVLIARAPIEAARRREFAASMHALTELGEPPGRRQVTLRRCAGCGHPVRSDYSSCAYCGRAKGG